MVIWPFSVKPRNGPEKVRYQQPADFTSISFPLHSSAGLNFITLSWPHLKALRCVGLTSNYWQNLCCSDGLHDPVSHIRSRSYVSWTFSSEHQFRQVLVDLRCWPHPLDPTHVHEWGQNWSAVVQTLPERPVYQSVYVSTLTDDHELWEMAKRTRSPIQEGKRSFLRRAGGSLHGISQGYPWWEVAHLVTINQAAFP